VKLLGELGYWKRFGLE